MTVFRQLTKLEVKDMSSIMMNEVFESLRKKGIQLKVTNTLRDRVVDEGYDLSYGARPLRYVIMRLLEDSLAEKLLAGEIAKGDSVIVHVASDGTITVLLGSIPVPETLIYDDPDDLDTML